MRKTVPLIVWILFLTTNLNAISSPDLLQLLEEIKAGRKIIQNSSTAFLVTCKKLGASQPAEERSVRITSQSASIRDADQANAGVLIKMQAGTLLPVLRKDGDWFLVKLPDLREGWIHQDDVQETGQEQYKVSGDEDHDPEMYYQTRMLAENYYNQFSGAYDKVEQLTGDFEKKYNSLSESNRRNAASYYEEMKREQEAVKLARAYTDHYYKKLPPFQVIKPGKILKSQNIGFDGTASARFGSSAYESGGQISETTRNISLGGNVIFSPHSRLAINLNHNKDVIRSPFTTTTANAAYSYETQGGTRVNTSVSFQDYGDELTKQNSFRNIGAGLNAEHPVNANIRLSGDVQVQSKSFYDTDNGNDLEGVQFNTLIDYKNKNTSVNAGIRGRFQSSDISFLDYRRIIPSLRLTFKTGQKNWSLYGEAEKMAYSTAAESADYDRLRIDLETSNSKTRTQLSAINRSFPNNESFNNLKIRILNEVYHRSADRNGRSTGYIEYTFNTSDLNTSSNYIDLRFDRNFSRKTGYFDIGAFGRYWEEGNSAHRLSVYSRFGLKFSGVQIGPIVGADMLIDQADPDLKQTGNSFRAGIDGRGNFLIQKASVYSSVRYQYTLAYSGLDTSGDPLTRNPVSLEITAGARIPVARKFEVQLDLRYYKLDFDIPEIDDPLPVQTQSGLRYLAGISYRF